jgi:nitrite reductase/ring-hydroxylating ferredoxin subunit
MSRANVRDQDARNADAPAQSGGRVRLGVRGSGAALRHMREPPRHPHGWFAPLRSGEVAGDRPTPFSFMGHELVAFRGASGAVRVLDATCPHFGAHLGHGEVAGGCVRCPFHKLAFDGAGRCTGAAAHYDQARVGHLRTRAWASAERFGMIFVWHGPDPARPAWKMPLDALDWEGWTAPITNDGIVMPRVQPMWVAENIADIAHLRTVHCWDLVRVVETPREHDDGCYRIVVDVVWRLGAMSRSPRARALGRWVNSPFRLEAKILDPGVVVAEATLTEAQGSHKVRNVVLVRPVGERDAHLRILVSVRRRIEGAWVRGAERLTGFCPERLLARVLVEIGTEDFRSDAEIWSHRRHLEAPRPLEGDGPLVDFRRWSTRFWPDAHAR